MKKKVKKKQVHHVYFYKYIYFFIFNLFPGVCFYVYSNYASKIARSLCYFPSVSRHFASNTGIFFASCVCMASSYWF
uniref:photosystem II protein K n=1 Tax=Gloiopeltis furcata TaxID=42017 RepID=UPI0028D907D5|nr:photosystem II protein K [Gloiopeltis furcata]WMP13920.1 photosystem II protein K [Gloiopeltis furcata]